VPDFEVPEETNLYLYANDNPMLYTDPTGRFELVEINISISISDNMQAMKAAAIQKARATIRQKILDAVTQYAWNTLQTLCPQLRTLRTILGEDRLGFGNQLQSRLQFRLAQDLGFPDWIWLAPEMNPAGTPESSGINPGQGITRAQLDALLSRLWTWPGNARPDFVLGEAMPAPNQTGPNWTVGDIKASVLTIVNDYTTTNGPNYGKQINQFHAIAGYAERYLQLPFAVWVTAQKGGNYSKNIRIFTQLCVQEVIGNGGLGTFFYPYILILLSGRP
jgi:hypothetical protein